MNALVVIGDGRIEYLRQAVESARQHLPFFPRDWHLIMVNDSGDGEYHLALCEEFPEFEIRTYGPRRGMSAAVELGWATALETDAGFLFHLEEDFVLQRTVPIDWMEDLFRSEHGKNLAQLVLQRQPWSVEEHQRGRVLTDEQLFGACQWDDNGRFMRWVAQKDIFSLNPCLVPRRVAETLFTPEWPTDPGGVERALTRRLSPAYHFAFWGAVNEAPSVNHIGHERSRGWAL